MTPERKQELRECNQDKYWDGARYSMTALTECLDEIDRLEQENSRLKQELERSILVVKAASGWRTHRHNTFTRERHVQCPRKGIGHVIRENSMTRRNCKHTNTETRWHQCIVRSTGTTTEYVKLLRCVDCGEMCSMGPSRTEDRVEVWAALLTSERECFYNKNYYLPQYTMASLGWRGIVCPPEIESTLYLAGHLARCIADHDELQRTGEEWFTKEQRIELDRQAQACADDRLSSADPPYRHTRCTNGGCLFYDRCQSPLSCEGRR